MTRSANRLVLAAVAIAAFQVPLAQAACFEEVGCTNSQRMASRALEEQSCDTLWTIRNTIYHENGYCFRTERGRAVFSNEGCITYNAGALRLNPYERANIQMVTRVETELTCR